MSYDYSSTSLFPNQPKKSNTWVKVLAITGGLGLLLCGGGAVACTGLFAAGAHEVQKQTAVDKKSVTITSCDGQKIGDHTMVTPKFSIKNETKKTRNYLVQIDIYDEMGKTRLAETHGAANNVAPGVTGNGANVPAEIDTKKWKCVVSNVIGNNL